MERGGGGGFMAAALLTRRSSAAEPATAAAAPTALAAAMGRSARPSSAAAAGAAEPGSGAKQARPGSAAPRRPGSAAPAGAGGWCSPSKQPELAAGAANAAASAGGCADQAGNSAGGCALTLSPEERAALVSELLAQEDLLAQAALAAFPTSASLLPADVGSLDALVAIQEEEERSVVAAARAMGQRELAAQMAFREGEGEGGRGGRAGGRAIPSPGAAPAAAGGATAAAASIAGVKVVGGLRPGSARPAVRAGGRPVSTMANTGPSAASRGRPPGPPGPAAGTWGAPAGMHVGGLAAPVVDAPPVGKHVATQLQPQVATSGVVAAEDRPWQSGASDTRMAEFLAGRGSAAQLKASPAKLASWGRPVSAAGRRL